MMTEKKKMYVVFCEDNEKYWCSYNILSDQLRKATIFYSIKYANEVHKRYKELRLKNVEVRMGVVHEKPTNADRLRSMSDEELATHLHDIGWDCHLCAEHGRLDNEPLLRGEKCDEKCVEHCLEWLKKPAEVI